MTNPEKSTWIQRTDVNRPAEDSLTDPIWRLAWLYHIIDRKGKRIPFRPTREQAEVILAIHHHGYKRLIIPKARQLGMSTVLALICLDQCLFTAGYKAALVDRKADEAETKLREKVRVAWESLDPALRASIIVPEGYDTASRLGFCHAANTAAPSCFEAGINFRGGTVQFLWISEWGWIQANDVHRSKEILAGSLPTADQGTIVVETTWEGGKGGDVWPLVDEALATPDDQKSPLHWRVMFFAWWNCDSYVQRHGHVDDATNAYLDSMEKVIHKQFTPGQRRWYAAQKRRLGRLVRQEFPTTMDECWHQPMSGAIFGPEIDQLRSLGRTQRDFEFIRELPLYTSWDLGMSDYTSLWLVQIHGTELLWLDWHECEGQPASYYAGVIQRWENQYKPITRHYLPHDAGRREIGSGLSYLDTLYRLGIRNVTVVPATQDVWWGIGQLRELLARSTFHKNCGTPRPMATGGERPSGLQCLEAYRKQTETGPNGTLRDAPVHDHTSHSADAARTFAEALAKGYVSTKPLHTGSITMNSSHPQHPAMPPKARMNVGG